ncbi:MAG: hypothetical protein ACQESR_17025 [Planctomycetota bacterium]
MESCSTQAVLPLVGLAADKVIRDRYRTAVDALPLATGRGLRHRGNAGRAICKRAGCAAFVYDSRACLSEPLGGPGAFQSRAGSLDG